jgi:hypothetical protein
MARDVNSAESDWATLEVTMPKNNKSTSAHFLKYDWLIILIIRSAPDGEYLCFLLLKYSTNSQIGVLLIFQHYSLNLGFKSRIFSFIRIFIFKGVDLLYEKSCGM